MSEVTKKLELQKLVDAENGKGFYKNVDFSGYTFYKGSDNFISFKIKEVNGVNAAIISYVYVTNKNNLIKLLSFCVNFWVGNNVKFIYYLEHARPANYCKTYFKTLGITCVEEERSNAWRSDFESTNGYKKNDIREHFA